PGLNFARMTEGPLAGSPRSTAPVTQSGVFGKGLYFALAACCTIGRSAACCPEAAEPTGPPVLASVSASTRTVNPIHLERRIEYPPRIRRKSREDFPHTRPSGQLPHWCLAPWPPSLASFCPRHP